MLSMLFCLDMAGVAIEELTRIGLVVELIPLASGRMR